MTDIVIGSGPSGISAAVALLQRGRKVTLFDGGKQLENDLSDQRNSLSAMLPQNWSKQAIAAYQDAQFNTPEGQARRFGSDFAMEPANAILDDSASWFGLRASRATGGLSNLWGAAVLPYRQADIAAWPIRVDQLSEHYDAVAQFMPIAARPDGINDALPAHQIQKDNSLKPGPQAEKLLARLARTGHTGVHFGSARNAVAPGCTACGMCLHGCPWGYIYSAQHTLEQLKSNPDFSHRPHAIVTRFTEDKTGVSVHLTDGQIINGTRLFIGAGVLETARIVLNSSPSRDCTLTMLDSQHSLVPMLHRWRAPRRVDRMPLTTLPQLFVEMDLASVSPHLVHSQIYTWNEHYARDLVANFGYGLGISKPVFDVVARRLIIAQMFLHSDHSARVQLSLNGAGKLHPVLQENAETKPVLKSAQRSLGKIMSKSGLSMLGFASRPGAPGSSFHVGGTVPMAASAKAGQSDRIGRPFGLQRVHLIDASVFPSIPATTITFSAMANAHRIASEAPD